jgi:hypothetical protein
MIQRIPSALIVLLFASLAIICVRNFLDDTGVISITASEIRKGGPVFIVLDIFCGLISAVGIVAFTSLMFTRSAFPWFESYQAASRNPRP